MDTDENKCMEVHNQERNENDPVKDINDEINPIKDKLQEQNNNEIKTHKTTTEDPKIDASDKLPVPCQMDLDDPKSLSALKKLQDMSDYNFEAVNMNNNSDTNELTKDITNKGETISPIKDNTNKEVTTENVHEKNKFDNEELRKQVSLDESEDENDSESEEEEDNTFTCMYHKTTTDIENFNAMDKRYMKKTAISIKITENMDAEFVIRNSVKQIKDQ